MLYKKLMGAVLLLFSFAAYSMEQAPNINEPWLIFPKPAKELPTNLRILYDTVAFELVKNGGRVPPERLNEYKEHAETFLDYQVDNRPQVLLTGFEEAFPEPPHVPEKKLVLVTEQTLKDKELQDTNFERVYAKIQGDKVIVEKTEKVKKGAELQKATAQVIALAAQMRRLELSLEGSTGNCLVLRPKYAWAFVGCADGVIRVFDLIAERLRLKMSGHKKPIKALALTGHAGQFLISKSDDAAGVRYIRDRILRTRLNPVGTFKGEEVILQHHLVRPYVNKVFMYRDGHIVYTLPPCWLKGKSPANQQQALYIHELEVLCNLTEKEEDTEDRLNRLYNAAVLEKFEVPVRLAILRSIEEKAKAIQVNLEDWNYFCPED